MSKKKNKTIEELLDEALVPEEEQPYDVPENWVWVRNKFLSEVIRGVSYKKYQIEQNFSEDTCLVLRGGNIQENHIVNQEDNVHLSRELVKDYQLLKKNDVVIVSSTGSKKVIGKSASSEVDYNNVSFGAFLTTLRPIQQLNGSFYSFYFQLPLYQHVIRNASTGSNINNIKKDHLLNLKIPLPPINEQHRIADKVERLLDKVDQAKQLVEEAKETFELRRAAILDKAFRGELTKEWREDKEKVKSTYDLLEEIAEFRRKDYKLKCEEAKIKKERKPRKSFLDIIPVIEEKPKAKLPYNWYLTNIDFLGHVTKLAGFEYTKHIKLQERGEVPVIRAQNVQMGKFFNTNH